MESCTKGPRKNKFPFFAPRFGSDWVDLREQNHRRSRAYVEDFATEDRPKMARRWDAKMGSYFCAGPKAFQCAKKVFESDGGLIENASRKTALDVFPLTSRL